MIIAPGAMNTSSAIVGETPLNGNTGIIFFSDLLVLFNIISFLAKKRMTLGRTINWLLCLQVVS
jgi:hypothetical protein